MKRKIFVVLTVLLIVAVSSFGEEVQRDCNWKKQLEEIKQNEILKDKGYPQLVKYIYQDEVKTMDEVKHLKEQLLSYTDNYLPISSKDNNSVKLLNLQEIQQTEGEGAVAASVKSLTEYLDYVIQTGVHTVKLSWEFQAKTYESLCVVSDNGIVYDPIIINLMVVK